METEHHTMPAELAKAVNEVMGNVKMLAKSEKNPFAKYNFASIDAFLEMINPLCADAGLIIFQNEKSCDIVPPSGEKDKPWLLVVFEFTLAHTSGATWPGGQRSVMVPATGAQAFGSAQSYSLKQFMRALFQIPTGDKDDADLKAPEDLPKSAYKARKEGDWPKIEAEIRAHTDPEELKKWGVANRDRIHGLPANWVEHAQEEYARHLASITPVEPETPTEATEAAE